MWAPLPERALRCGGVWSKNVCMLSVSLCACAGLRQCLGRSWKRYWVFTDAAGKKGFWWIYSLRKVEMCLFSYPACMNPKQKKWVKVDLPMIPCTLGHRDENEWKGCSWNSNKVSSWTIFLLHIIHSLISGEFQRLSLELDCVLGNLAYQLTEQQSAPSLKVASASEALWCVG